MSDVEIQVGQVWRSRDKRDKGLTRTVEAIDGDVTYGNGFVTMRRGVRRSQVRAHTLRTRYSLVTSPEAPR